MDEELKESIGRYRSYPAGVFRALSLAAVLVGLLWGWMIFLQAWADYPAFLGSDQPTSRERLFFLTYLVLWVVMWSVYFTSGTQINLLKAQTLRRLLRETSKEWEPHKWEESEFYQERHPYYDQMAGKSLTAIAVMVTASLIVLAQVNAVASTVDFQCQGPTCDIWGRFLIVAAATAGLVAFVGFTLSVDLIDSMFIHYRSEALRRRLQHRFFRLMVNRRYIALVCLLSSTVFLAAVRSPLLGCLAIAIYFAVGSANWFPAFEEGRQHHRVRFAIRLVSTLLLSGPFFALWFF